jgi:hypothetical protein
VSRSSLEHGTLLELCAASFGVEQHCGLDQCFACKGFTEKLITKIQKVLNFETGKEKDSVSSISLKMKV